MKILITFTKGEKTLTKFIRKIEKTEDFPNAISEAHEQFRQENPDVLLVDGVTVHYDKAD